jgi:hypothetical protein
LAQDRQSNCKITGEAISSRFNDNACHVIPLGEELSTRGCQLTSLKEELQSNPDAIDKLIELYRVAREGWPSPDPTWQLETSTESLRSQLTTVEYPNIFQLLNSKVNM